MTTTLPAFCSIFDAPGHFELEEDVLACRDTSDIEIVALTGESHPAMDELEVRLLSEDDVAEG